MLVIILAIMNLFSATRNNTVVFEINVGMDLAVSFPCSISHRITHFACFGRDILALFFKVCVHSYYHTEQQFYTFLSQIQFSISDKLYYISQKVSWLLKSTLELRIK